MGVGVGVLCSRRKDGYNGTAGRVWKEGCGGRMLELKGTISMGSGSQSVTCCHTHRSQVYLGRVPAQLVWLAVAAACLVEKECHVLAALKAATCCRCLENLASIQRHISDP